MAGLDTNGLNQLLQSLGSIGKTDPLSPIDTSGFADKVAPGGSVAGSLAGADANPMSLMERLFGDAEGKTDGLVIPGIAAGTGLANAFLGMKQFGLAEDQFDFQKKAFNKNFEVQKNLTNSNLSDRQNARNAANPGAYASTADYMAQYGVK